MPSAADTAIFAEKFNSEEVLKSKCFFIAILLLLMLIQDNYRRKICIMKNT